MFPIENFILGYVGGRLLEVFDDWVIILFYHYIIRRSYCKRAEKLIIFHFETDFSVHGVTHTIIMFTLMGVSDF